MPELTAYTTSLTHNRVEAEGIAQDAILRALEARSIPKNLSELRPWLFRVAKNVFIDRKRKERVRREYSRTEGRLSENVINQTSNTVQALIVRQAYYALGSRDREILCLIDILGLTYAQAAEVIDVPIGTIMSRVSRARRAMRERMDDLNVHPIRKKR
ncbi:sigma-70 family RNA polymerase sigma factor [Aliiroseovarius sp. KMU-50]|uniref:Sigma-70 family RNA polymerase sigma factor n=1 Tax=Aliiroseovarius salicola TaxID=3009082 RepID=A0ABT4W5L0_9RHOB|nr:sigma-70 family RNA polymerase sigma factor [Aliiroseovarius sp. KMU-50]MDA5095806.1 sigma-70 family RNA polymerase sigma factor [Aliiroseovarius sp. KMU-50]